jgi:hypothetical protein
MGTAGRERKGLWRLHGEKWTNKKRTEEEGGMREGKR